jgi:hypothetical protein
MKREEILKTIKDSPASMFTKDDVYALLEKLDTLEGEKNNIIECLRISIGERLSSSVLYDIFIENLEKDSASFSLNYDKIVLEEVDIDTYKVNTKLMDNIMDIVGVVVTDLIAHAGGSSCDGDCGSCNTHCEEWFEEIAQEASRQEPDAEEDTSNTPL